MILISILAIILLLLVLFCILAAGVGGAAFTIIFADVIVCVALIGMIIKKLWKRRKK